MSVNGVGPRPRKQAKVSFIFPRSHGEQHCAGINALALSRDDDSLWTASRDGTLIQWSVAGDPTPIASCSGHTDWVNDMALLPGDLIASASADRTLRVWRRDDAADERVCTAAVAAHSDYITSLACATSAGVLVSAGLRGELLLWDVETLSTSTLSAPPPPAVHATSLPGPSFYCVASNEAGTLVAAGAADGGVRLVDPRVGAVPLRTLRGHSDVVRCVLASADGSQLVTGSADGTVRVWDAAAGRCVSTLAPHLGSVWALAAADPALRVVFSGGRDGSVYATDLGAGSATRVCETGAPLSALALGPRGALWTASPESSRFQRWDAAGVGLGDGGGGEGGGPRPPPLPRSFQSPASAAARARMSWGEARPHPPPLSAAPLAVSVGLPPLRAMAVTTDRLHVLTQDAVGAVELWDVTNGAVARRWTPPPSAAAAPPSAAAATALFQIARREVFDPASSVGPWFAPDIRLGSVGGTLDPGGAFGSEAYARDLGAPSAPADAKVNCGALMLQALLRPWADAEHAFGGLAAEDGAGGVDRSPTSGHPPLRDANGAAAREGAPAPPPPPTASFTLDPERVEVLVHGELPWRCTPAALAAARGDASLAQHRVPPAWAQAVVLDGKVPVSKDLKMAFSLLPVEGSGLPSLLQSRLHAPRVLTIDKVMDYVARRLKELGLSPGEAPLFYSQQAAAEWETARAAAALDADGAAVSAGGSPAAAAPQLPPLLLTCAGVVVPWDFTLAAVRQWMWKRSDDLTLHYSMQRGGAPLTLPTITLPSIDT